MGKQRIEPAVDERVAQESNRQMAKCFRASMIVNVLLLAVKIVYVLRGSSWLFVLPEVCALAAGGGGLLVLYTKKGLWGPADERILAEKTDCLCRAWRYMGVSAVVCCMVLILLRVDKDAYMLSAIGEGIVASRYDKRLVRAGVFHQQGERMTKKTVLKAAGSCVLFIVAMMLAATVLNGEMLPLEAYILTAVIFVVISACAIGWQWVQELVSEQNADDQLKAAEEADEE